MSLEQKVGQLFFSRFNNKTQDSDITEKYVGGFVLFGVDFNDPDANHIIKNIEYIQKLSQKTMNVPLGLSVDEEGGTVTRISFYKFHRSEPFPSPHEIYEKSGLDGLLEIEKEKRELLRKFKMNVNLAPVADFTNNESDYIYGRTLGYPLNETIQYISKEVSEYNEDNFTCCAKHFPGYGNNKNTHDVIAIDERPYEIFEKEDLKPFIAGIEQKIPMILVSHNIVKCKDKNFPASISETWHNILRNELNFSGLILTDDLSMNAIKLYSGGYSPAIIAINAGNDILLTSQLEEHLTAAIDAAKNGTISNDTIEKACKRIIAWKLKYIGKIPIDDEENGEKGGEEEKGGKGGKEGKGGKGGNGNAILIISLSIVGIVILGVIIYVILQCFVFKKKSKGTIDESLTPIERNDD
jgi:beta-N-acetylhexosaminidase